MYLKEIHLLTDDLAETKRFYATELECTIDSMDTSSITFITGGTKLVFKQSEELTPYYHVAFDIPVNKLEEAYQWIKKRANIIPSSAENDLSDFKSWNARSFYFYDNNGSVLEFICRFDLHYHSNLPFHSSDIVHVSEIGIVTTNVWSLSDQLISQFDLEIFSRQPRQDNFTVIGNDMGLFIIVEKERAWFPTKKPAKSFQTKIIFESKEKMHELFFD